MSNKMVAAILIISMMLAGIAAYRALGSHTEDVEVKITVEDKK